MIKRIVKMTFHKENVDDFLKIFEESNEKIKNFSGCSHLELLQDLKSPNTFFTYSFWENEKALNEYRNSTLFKSTWAKTKVLFAEKPEAWSVKSRLMMDKNIKN